jgi:long-subunit fatty acid transport protein
MRRPRLAAAFALATFAPAAARAGGILVGEAGSQAQERGGAFVAKADDPSALSLNPAGLIKAEGTVAVYLGANLLHFGLDYQRAVTAQTTQGEPTTYPGAHNGSNWQPIPELTIVEKITPRLAIAEGLYAPQGFPNRDFACLANHDCTVDATGTAAPQRYDIIHQEVIIAFPSIAVSYRLLPSLDVGVRASWGFATVKARNFTWAGVNHAEDPGYDGDFEASTTDKMVLSFGFGALFRPTDSIEIGGSFSTGGQVHSSGDGDATLGDKVQFLGEHLHIEPVADSKAACGHGGTVAQLKTCIDFGLPRKAQLGGRYIFRDGRGRERADLELDLRWEGHNADSDITVIVDGQDSSALHLPLKPTLIRHGFDNVLSARLGGAYRFDIGGDQGITLRAGLAYDTAAAPDSWTRTDIDGRPRAMASMGVAYDVPGWRFDVGFSVVAEPDVDVTRVANASPNMSNRSQPDPPQPLLAADEQVYHPINEGHYSSGYLIGSAGITASF